MENFKAYTYAFILYKDSKDYNYNDVIEYISSTYEKYAYIEHKPENDETKFHTHVIVHFPNKRYRNSLSQELGIPINYIIKVQLKPYLRYLIHYDDEDKIQYTYDDVKGTLKNMLIDITKTNSEESNFSEILLYINNKSRNISFTELTNYCIHNNFYSVYRRNISALKLLLKEHNENIFNDNF